MPKALWAAAYRLESVVGYLACDKGLFLILELCRSIVMRVVGLAHSSVGCCNARRVTQEETPNVSVMRYRVLCHRGAIGTSQM